MILVIQERKAPLFRGRPDFILSETYRVPLRKIVPQEIGYYFDELEGNVVRVITSAGVPAMTDNGDPVLGYVMEEKDFFMSKFWKLSRK